MQKVFSWKQKLHVAFAYCLRNTLRGCRLAPLFCSFGRWCFWAFRCFFTLLNNPVGHIHAAGKILWGILRMCTIGLDERAYEHRIDACMVQFCGLVENRHRVLKAILVEIIDKGRVAADDMDWRFIAVSAA